MKRKYVYIVAALAVGALLFSGSARSQEVPPWPVKEKLLGANGDKAEDVSGIACSSQTGFPRTCLLVDDEAQGAQIVIVRDGGLLAGDFIRLIYDAFEDDLLEFDGEGVAYADGHFYVIGSHGHPRDKDKKLDPTKPKDAAKIKASIQASSRVIRITMDPSSVNDKGKLNAAPEIKPSAELRTLLAAQSQLKGFVDLRLDQNGLTIEGIAVRDKRLFVGLRGPVLGDNGDKAAIYSVELASLFEGKPGNPKLDLLALGKGRGVRDLVAIDKGLIVLAGPAAEEDGVYTAFHWDGGDARSLGDLPKFTGKKGKQSKPEGLLVLDNDVEGLRVLVLFDGPKEGSPRALRVSKP